MDQDDDICSPICCHGASEPRWKGYKVFRLIAYTACSLVVAVCKINKVHNISHSRSQRQEKAIIWVTIWIGFVVDLDSVSYRVNEDFVRWKYLWLGKSLFQGTYQEGGVIPSIQNNKIEVSIIFRRKWKEPTRSWSSRGGCRYYEWDNESRCEERLAMAMDGRHKDIECSSSCSKMNRRYREAIPGMGVHKRKSSSAYKERPRIKPLAVWRYNK